MALADELKTLLRTNGADIVGFADLQSVTPDIRDGFPYGVAIAVALSPQIVAEIIDGPNWRYYAEYERANNLLDSLGRCAVDFLEEWGHRARCFPATNFEIDPFACRRAAQEWEVRRKGVRDNICGMCIAACPWTQNYIKNNTSKTSPVL